jgi:hypothetical protein
MRHPLAAIIITAAASFLVIALSRAGLFASAEERGLMRFIGP